MRLPTIVLLACMMLAAAPAPAQLRDPAAEIDRPTPPPPAVDDSVIRAPLSNSRQVGQRQTREDAARETGIKPMARITDRINNRIQSRVRNRIDRHYDPSPDARSAITIAEDQISVSGPPRR